MRITARGGTLAGRVVDQAGLPVRGRGAVVVYPNDLSLAAYPSRFVKSTPIQSDGTFEIQGIPAGSYLVAAVPKLDDGWPAAEALARLGPSAVSAKLTAAGRVSVTLHMRSDNP